jgi:hypothetical protein
LLAVACGFFALPIWREANLLDLYRHDQAARKLEVHLNLPAAFGMIESEQNRSDGSLSETLQ